MARYQIILAYDGTHFLGSQRQAASRTVQGALEKALRMLGWTRQTVFLAGRTDTGTHASGQVAAFDLDWGHSLDDLQKALNYYLPQDMVVREAKLAADDFHPRFNATSRRYRYRLFCAGVRDPLRERYAWRVWPAVTDLIPLAAIWPGTHDFGAYGTSPRKNGNTVRRILYCEWQNQGDEWTFDIQADAFLYHMVRRLVYVQVAVGQGRLSEKLLCRALENSPGKDQLSHFEGMNRIPASLAPASGLTLVEVYYDNLV
jgi:tRNA pseudouridine38-40 synthase